MTKEIIIRSYFSLPTNLAQEMRNWKEFVNEEDYSVDLSSDETGETVTVRYIEKGEDYYVLIVSSIGGKLFERVVGKTVIAMSMNSDNLMVSKH